MNAECAPPKLPGWIRIIDGAILLLVGVLSWKILSDNTRAGLFGFIPHVRNPFLLYAILGLAGVRHIVLPRPTLLARVGNGWRRLADAPDWGPAIRTFVGTRTLVLVVALYSVAILGIDRAGFVLSGDTLTNLPARFDAGWYAGIALHGYDRSPVDLKQQRNIAFFPAMPMLMRAVGPLFGTSERGLPEERRAARILWSGVFISLCAFLLALWYILKLGQQFFDRERAAGAALLIAAYPFAYFFNAPYTESLFLLGAVAAAYHFGRQEWVVAGVWGLLVGLTRPNGFLLSVPLALIAFQRYARSRGAHSHNPYNIAAALAAAAMPIAGMLAFTVYLYTFTNVWFVWSRSHAAWGRSYTGFSLITAGYERLRDDGLIDVVLKFPVNTLNSIAATFALLMIWPVVRHVGPAWGIYSALTIIPPMLAGGALSLGRQTSTLFPMFLALAAVVPSRSVPALAAGFAIVQGFGAALFFTWRELF